MLLFQQKLTVAFCFRAIYQFTSPPLHCNDPIVTGTPSATLSHPLSLSYSISLSLCNPRRTAAAFIATQFAKTIRLVSYVIVPMN